MAGVFLKMPFCPCPLGCGHYLWLYLIFVASVWVSNTLSCVRVWLMRPLWTYEHGLAAISPLFCEKKKTCPGLFGSSNPKGFHWPVSSGFQHFIQCAPGRSDVDSSIRGWATILWGWRFSGDAPLGCCRHRLIRPGVDGHACPGSHEYQAGGQQTAQSLAVGWLLSQSSQQWSAPVPPLRVFHDILIYWDAPVHLDW